jgi:hypothetical protein
MKRWWFAWAWLLIAFASHAATPDLRDGDVVFQTSRSTQSVAVRRATASRYSHMGVVMLHDGRPFVFEAAGRVQYTPWAAWVARGEGGHVVVKRLKNAPDVLTPTALGRFRQAARSFEGRPYDLTFEWSDDRIYCSELVWKLYQRALGIEIGTLQQIRDFKLDDPAVRQKMKERYGEHVPLEEPVISPVAMFESPLLTTVMSD